MGCKARGFALWQLLPDHSAFKLCEIDAMSQSHVVLAEGALPHDAFCPVDLKERDLATGVTDEHVAVGQHLDACEPVYTHVFYIGSR